MGERMKGKIAIVTGGNSGIGAATAQMFVEQGASVMIAAPASCPSQIPRIYELMPVVVPVEVRCEKTAFKAQGMLCDSGYAPYTVNLVP